MGRKLKKTSPIKPTPEPESIPTPVSLFPAAATAVVSASSSSAASSSSSDAPSVVKQPVADVVSESESESESDSESPPPPPKPAAQPVNKQPASESASESESESESDAPPPKPAKSVEPTTGSSAKRPAEAVPASQKRAKKDGSEPVVTTAVTPSKALFQRLWSNEDELLILKGLIEFKEMHGVIDPVHANHSNDFLRFIKKTVHVDADKKQFVGKVRRLKKRFDTSLKKKKKLTDEHEIKVYELAKKIWPEGEVPVVVEPKNKKADVNVNGNVNVEVVGVKGGFENVAVGMELGFDDESGMVLREAMKRVEGAEKNELKSMVDKANVAYLDAYVLRLKVLEVAAKKILDGIKTD